MNWHEKPCFDWDDQGVRWHEERMRQWRIRSRRRGLGWFAAGLLASIAVQIAAGWL